MKNATTIKKSKKDTIIVTRNSLFEIIDLDGLHESGDLVSVGRLDVRAAIAATIADGETRIIEGAPVADNTVALAEYDAHYASVERAMTLDGGTY